MRYPVNNMDSALSTISVSSSGNRSLISNEVRAGYGTSDSTKLADDLVNDLAERRTQRKPRWQNAPGIQVSLDSLDQEQHRLDEYQQLRSDGRRKGSTKIVPSAGMENTYRTIEADQPEKQSANPGSPRSVNPRTKIILDSFIQQMGGGEESLSNGSYISTSV